MTIKNISAVEAKNLVDAGKAIIIDVRELDEYNQERIEGVENFPLSTLPYEITKINASSKQIIFQCKGGVRSMKACGIATSVFGDMEFLNLEGGIEAWKNSGLKTINQNNLKKNCNLSIFRQVQIIIGGLISLFIVLGLTVSSAFLIISLALSIALTFSGISGWCGLALILQKMPWNK
jgi:rhodanese-related sulfurtransferase